MDYFSIVNLDKEPFSNSPDPDFFYGSGQHLDCLQKLELALRLRRGLNVVVGEVGTGKTTLCRQLIRRFDGSDEFETHLILDPHFAGPTEFLQGVAGMLTGKKPSGKASDWQLKETIKNYLFQRGVDENRTVILIIDEGQKLPSYCLELLREFLNYETNEYKLLQIVIFAQKEFSGIIDTYANFADRINLYHLLKPMSFRDTRAMIRFRLEKSSSGPDTFTFFSWPALVMIYITSGGYPRKIINLCHRCILTMIIQNRTVVDLLLVRTCIQRGYSQKSPRMKRKTAVFTLTALAIAGLVAVLLPQFLDRKPDLRFRWPPLEKTAIAPPRVTQKITPTPTPPQPAKPAAPETGDTKNVVFPAAVSATPPPSPETSASAAVERPPVRYPDPAEVLGRITIQRNETFSGLAEQVYGVFNPRYFKLMILANPQIENPDRIAIGETLVLPAIPSRQQPANSNSWWILLAEKNTLEEAFSVLRSLPRDAPAIGLVPFWNPEYGYRFAVVLERHFPNEASARNHLQTLPHWIAADSRVERLPSKETVYFADPLFAHNPN